MRDTDPTPSPAPSLDLGSWLRLAAVPGVGRITAAQLLRHFGSPAAIFSAAIDQLLQHVTPAQASALCAPASSETARLLDTTLAWLEQPGNRILSLLDPAYPPLLAEIPDPPLLLYIRGRHALLQGAALAIVGSRNASVQGQANARAFAAALSAAGITIVSGLALGIDTAAHEGALRGCGSTAAIIGTGADRIYPARNAALARRIAEEGCMVSEYPLATPPRPEHFPQRNRIISGLTAGVLVIEAAAGSGSLITARMANEQGRDVFALPGSIHATLSKGCHQLIRDGAQLVETSDEVLLALSMAPLVRTMQPTPAPVSPLLALLGHEAIHIDTILSQGALSASALSAELLELELAGIVARLPGGMLQRVHR
ncbi:DNA-processing protein DprA [Massilia sp. S19_KUP03_FR1]|uniref:DNA-processing protein DprA n=1 Tax=Massilia sp. S19_KUP03_FR1 TaxID=3025503 RepID=UPI002FCCC5B4